MKLGFVSAIFGDLAFEEVVSFAASAGYKCIEICCWPQRKSWEKICWCLTHWCRYAWWTKGLYINNFLRDKGVEISALGYYPNPLDPDEERARFYVSHIKKVIDASVLLGLNRINTFIGRDKNRSVDENFGKIFLCLETTNWICWIEKK